MRSFKELLDEDVKDFVKHATKDINKVEPDHDLSDDHLQHVAHHAKMAAHHAAKAHEYIQKGHRRGFFAHTQAADRHNGASVQHLYCHEMLRSKENIDKTLDPYEDLSSAAKQSKEANEATRKARKHP